MTTNQQQNNIPKLRFQNFNDEWIVKKLESVASEIMYGIGAAAKEFDGRNKYLRITDINESSRLFLPNPLTSPKGEIDAKYYLKENDIVFARTGASVGKSYIYNKNDGVLIFAGFLIKVNIKGENSNFVFQHTLRGNYRKWVEAMSMRSGQPGLNAEEYKSIKLYYPSLEEQQKIASFLTAVDKKISQLQKKKALLKQYKKGVMQQIFSQQLRFKIKNQVGELVEPPDWEEKKLGEVVEKISSGKTKPKLEGKYNVYGSTGIIGKANEYSHSGDFLLIARVGANAGTINSVEGKFGVTDNTLVVQTKEGLNINYLKYFLIKFNLNRLIFGSGQPLITGGQLKSLKLIFPTLKEQTKIANFLSAIDTKIELVNTQLENTQQFKKGLLQQMFV